MASASPPRTKRKSLGCLSVYIPAMSTQGPVLGSPSVSGSWNDIMDRSGSNRSPDKDQPSTSASPSEEKRGRCRRILIVEDNAADVYLIRSAIEAARIQADLHVVKDGELAIRFIDETDTDNRVPCPDLVILDLNLPRMHG